MGGYKMVKLKSMKKLESKVTKKVSDFLTIYDAIHSSKLSNLFELVFIDRESHTIEEISLQLHFCSRTIQRNISFILQVIIEVQKRVKK